MVYDKVRKTLRQNLKGLDKKEYEILKKMSHKSKDLYNETLYEVRQHFFNNKEYLNYYNAYKLVKPKSENYKVLPSQVAQQTMKHVDKAFQSFFKLVEKKEEGKYNGKTNLPDYLDKNGHFSLVFPNQSFQVKEDYIRIGIPKEFREKYDFEKTEIKIKFNYEKLKRKEVKIKQLHIIPKGKNCQYFEYRIDYEEEKEPIETEEGTWLSIDLGVDNLATCGDQSGHSFILDGRKLKSYNRWVNKEIARLQSIKDKQNIKGNTKKINKLFKDRNNYIHDYLNKVVNLIVEYCKKNRIEKVVVGDGKGWKQKVNNGDKNNQNFVQIPYDKLKQKLKQKLEHYGIEFELVDESHTSKCSFFDGEPVKHHKEYVGNRIERGLFKTSDGKLVNADVNGLLNIARKGKLETSGVESSGVVDTPKRIRKPFELQSSLETHS